MLVENPSPNCFLGPLSDHVAIIPIEPLSSYDLWRVRGVDRRAQALVRKLFSLQSFWSGCGFETGKVPTEAQVKRAFALVKRARETRGSLKVLGLPIMTSPVSWMIIKRLDLIPLSAGSNPREVVNSVYEIAEFAAGVGDAGLLIKVLDPAKFSPMQLCECMDKAIRGEQPDIVEMLLNIRATCSFDGFAYLLEGHMDRQIAIAERLVALQPDLQRLLSDMQWAAFRGKIEEFNALTRTTEPWKALNDLPGPLHFAARQGHLEAAEMLLDLGCPIDGIDRDGQTALHHAASRGHTKVIKLLLSRDCDTEVEDDLDQTALEKAAENGQKDAVVLLDELLEYEEDPKPVFKRRKC